MNDEYDKRSFEARMQSNFKNRTGSDWSPQATVDSFVLYGPQQRADALDQLDLEISKTGELSIGSNEFVAAADRVVLQQQLRELHQKMLEVKR